MLYWLPNKLIEFINSANPILFVSPSHLSFGNGSEDIFYGLLQATRMNKKVLFIYPRSIPKLKKVSISNVELFSLEHDRIFPSNSFLGTLLGYGLTFYYGLLLAVHWVRRRKSALVFEVLSGSADAAEAVQKPFHHPWLGKNGLWVPSGLNDFEIGAFRALDWERQYEAYTPPRIAAEKLQFCQEEMSRMGVPDKAWFVCLHVRGTEAGETRNTRWADINTYRDAMKEITSRGGWVIRIGDATSPRLPESPCVIDYAHYDRRQDILDLYLLSHCRFFLGNSGPLTGAKMFRTTVISTNSTEWSTGLGQNTGDETILKHVYSRIDGRELTVSELFNQPFDCQLHDLVAHDEYEFVDNSPEELAEVVRDHFAHYSDYSYSDKQEEFNRTRRDQVLKWILQGEPKKLLGARKDQQVMQQYRAAALSTTKGTLGRSFVEKNWKVQS